MSASWRTRNGFTVVEVLIAIAIVGILAGLVGVLVGPALWQSRTKPTCASNLKGVVSALHLYVSDNDDNYPKGAWDVYRATKPYKPVTSCPLVSEREYFTVFNFAWLEQKHGADEASFWPDGRPLPAFDIQRDVLFRCLFHGKDGWTFHPKQWFVTDDRMKGQVLGARWDGSVAYVSPVSCWDLRHFSNRQPLDVLINANPPYRTCDRPN